MNDVMEVLGFKKQESTLRSLFTIHTYAVGGSVNEEFVYSIKDDFIHAMYKDSPTSVLCRSYSLKTYTCANGRFILPDSRKVVDDYVKNKDLGSKL